MLQPESTEQELASLKLDNLKKAIKLVRSGNKELAVSNHTSPMFLATAQAICLGLPRITCMEFGVAQGRGLLSLVDLAEFLSTYTEIEFEIFGFDTTTGLTEILDYRDHPEIWTAGQYAMSDADALIRQLPANATLVEGDVRDTVQCFVKERLTDRAPVGFISIDLDLYSSTKRALDILMGPPEAYLPAVMMYFDDVDGQVTLNRWCGEELAIEEFNAQPSPRKIQRKVTKTPKSFACHVLDHPARNGVTKPVLPLSLAAVHYS